MTRHSSIVGGSTAGRLIECPGSYQATLALPPSADISSEYAAEGTAMHAVMDRLMYMRKAGAVHGISPHNTFSEARNLKGIRFHDRDVTQEHIDTMIEPAIRALHELEAAYGGGFEVLAIEKRVAFPGVPGAFGTIDLILGSPSHVLHVDWKFGQGVGVKASYTDDSGERLNPQMMFYVAAAWTSLRKFYSPITKKMVIAIIQPRGDEPLTHTVISKRDVKWFIEDLQDAAVKALDRDPVRARGEHCRFAPCKVNCPLWTAPMLDLAAMKVQPRTEVVERKVTPYGEYLANAKQLVDGLAMFTKEVNDQLHAYLEDGGSVPGWRLKLKAKQRRWVDEEIVEHALEDIGFDTNEIWRYELVTFQQADATAKRLGVKIPDELRVAPPTNETTVCRTDDPAPAVERRLAVEQFAASLALLTNPAKG